MAIENEELTNFLTGIIVSDTWIGLNDRSTKGQYKWSINSRPLRGYKNWDPRNPDFENDDDCVYMQRNGKWGRNYCNEYLSFICEYDLERTGIQNTFASL